MDNTVRASLLFLSFVVAIASLYFIRDILAPFALAVFFWLIIDAFARWIDGLSKAIPYWLGLTVAILTVILGFIGVVSIIADTGFQIAAEAPYYKNRLFEILSWVDGLVNMIGGWFGQTDFSLKLLEEKMGITAKAQQWLVGIAASTDNVFSQTMMIIIYIAFLFAAQSSFPKKMDELFPNNEERVRAGRVAMRIRTAVEKYLSVQTLMSLIQTILSYIVMVSLGLDNALFWAMVIFILNYIPIIGGILAVILPLMFALVQFESLTRFGVLAGGLFLVQFIINNTLQPKMMGDSMNLSALVVVIALVIWTALWGGVGAFLSAPLTVIMMIIMAQFSSTRWIAILLSAEGHPDMDDDPVPDPVPGM